MEEASNRERMKALLRYANFSKVGAAVGVKRASVARWAKGENITVGRLEQIEQLFGLETQQNAAPSMTRRLLAGVMALERKADVTPSELAVAESSAAALEAALEADARLAAELAGSQRKSGGRSAGRVVGQVGGSQGNKRRKPR